MAGSMTVKELINERDLANFFDGVKKSQLRKGNKVVLTWLSSSTHIKRKLRKVFHKTKFKLSQIEKGARRETEDDNKHTILKLYLDILVSVTQLGMYPFPYAEKELKYALDLGDLVLQSAENFEHFPTLLKLLRLTQILSRPQTTIE